MVLNERAPAFTTSNLSVSSQRSTKGFPTALGKWALPLVSCFLFQDFSMAEEMGVHQWFKTLNAWSRLYTEHIHSLLFIKDFTEQGRERDFIGYFMSCIYQSQLVLFSLFLCVIMLHLSTTGTSCRLFYWLYGQVGILSFCSLHKYASIWQQVTVFIIWVIESFIQLICLKCRSIQGIKSESFNIFSQKYFIHSRIKQVIVFMIESLNNSLFSLCGFQILKVRGSTWSVFDFDSFIWESHDNSLWVQCVCVCVCVC